MISGEVYSNHAGGVDIRIQIVHSLRILPRSYKTPLQLEGAQLNDKPVNTLVLVY